MMHDLRPLTFIALAWVPWLAGCANSQKKAEPSPIERMWEKPATAAPAPNPRDATVVSTSTSGPATGPEASAAALPPDPTDVLATVNGAPVLRSYVDQELVRTHGLNLLRQMILLVAARQRVQQMGLTVTPADVQAAHNDALKHIAAPVGAPEELPMGKEEAERLLNGFLLAKNIAPSEWERRMEQRACLRKIAAAEVEKTTITDQMLREEYALEYGERVQVRHIQLERLDDEALARSELAQGKDFELVARKLSKNPVTAARGGLLPSFTREDPAITPLLREAAFKMQIGDVSPAIHEDNWYHILRLEKRFPASGVGFDNVEKDALKSNLKERLIRQRMAELENDLFINAKVSIRDRELNEQFNRARSAQ